LKIQTVNIVFKIFEKNTGTVVPASYVYL